MQRKISQDFIKELAKKYNKPVYIIEGIIKSPFKMLAEIMRNADVINDKYDQIYIQNLGKFVVTPYRKKKIKDKYYKSRKYKALLKKESNDIS